MHLNMPAKVFQHQVRLLQRCHLLQKAHNAVPATFDYQVSAIDWDATRKKVPCNPAVGTVLSNGVNTFKRAYHHFHSVPSPLCEHSCGAEDGVSHRVLDCEGTSELRQRCRLGSRELELLRASCRSTAECAIWEFPVGTKEWKLDAKDGSLLWPTEEWMTTLMQTEVAESSIHMHFHYRKIDGGHHPELKRHSAQLTIDDDIPMPGQATSRWDCYTRSMWEMDAVIIAALVSIVKGVTVTISGLHDRLDSLWDGITLMRSSNVYLGRLCLTARRRIVEDPNADPDDVVLWEECMPPSEVMEKWNLQYATATKLVSFLERFLEYFPVAHQASRSHGIRGGCRPLPVVGLSVTLTSLASMTLWTKAPMQSVAATSPSSTLKSSITLTSST